MLFLIVIIICSRLLSGKSITNTSDIYEAMNILCNQGCKTIVVSSSNTSTKSELKCVGKDILSKHYLHKLTKT